MRRALALFLLVLSSFPLVAPAALAGAKSNLPACCRRNGEHHCGAMDEATASSGVAIHSVSRCPAFPLATTAPADARVAVLKNSAVIFGAIVSHPAIYFQTEASYRISFSRSRQKRGPPALLS
jgi:hypothetical protein